MSSKGSVAVRIIGAGLTAAALAFLVLAFRRLDLSTLRPLSGPFPWIIAFVLSCCYAVTVGVQGLAWRSTLFFLAPIKPPLGRTLSVYSRANIGKYLPGNVMHFVGRNFFGASLGIAQQDMAIGTLIEIMVLAGTAFLAAFGCALASGNIGEYSRFLDAARGLPLALAVLALLIVSAIAGIRSRKVRRAASALISKLSGAFLRSRSRNAGGFFSSYFFGLISLYLFNFLLNAVIVLVCANVYLGFTITYNSALTLSAAYIASWLAGFVVPGAPGGLGVREASFLLLSGASLGQGEALALAAVSRAICVAGDGIAFLAALSVQVPKPQRVR